jgi:hypothetical protein
VEGDGRYHVRADVDSEILRDAAERLVARGKPRREANARAVADERARIAGEIRAEIERCKADIRELVPAFEYSGAIGKTEAEIAALRLALKIVEAKGE